MAIKLNTVSKMICNVPFGRSDGLTCMAFIVIGSLVIN
jgi:hypothetical protein